MENLLFLGVPILKHIRVISSNLTDYSLYRSIDRNVDDQIIRVNMAHEMKKKKKKKK